jgi:hypothetical protein
LVGLGADGSVAHMFIACVRCGSPAAAVMSYDYETREVWVDDPRIVEPGTGYSLCAAHADRLTPPLGWTLTDQRTAVRLFAPLEVA